MKRILCLIIVVGMLFSLCACGDTGEGFDSSLNSGLSDNNDASNNDASVDSDEKDSVIKETTSSGYDIEVLCCEFDKEVMGLDEEISSWGFTERDGKVYINLTVKVTNNSKSEFGEDDIKGSYLYDGSTYDLQYSLAAVCPSTKDEDMIPKGAVGLINLISLIDEGAMNEDITVDFTIGGKEYHEKVGPIDTRSAFDKKTELKVGNKVNMNGFYDIEVISCTEQKNLRPGASKNGYGLTFGEDEKAIDLVLKIKNNTAEDFKISMGYVALKNGDLIRGDNRVETEDRTEFTYDSIKPNEERYIHVFVGVEDTVNTSGLAMRYNIGCECFYTVVG